MSQYPFMGSGCRRCGLCIVEVHLVNPRANKLSLCTQLKTAVMKPESDCFRENQQNFMLTLQVWRISSTTEAMLLCAPSIRLQEVEEQ